mmetsp:Transcript_9195/g.37743  ORF Transcript_9195/g.37743 Transcript_9195/m.37743 type:complete len:529 (+) Transcript_9195:1474-3060(+)
MRGFLAELGQDSFATFSPMSSLTTIRAIFAIAANKRLPVYHADVPNAFVQSRIDTDIYVKLPTGTSFTDLDGHKYKHRRLPKLLKSLYGLRQSPLLFNKEIDSFFQTTLGYERGLSDSCLYTKTIHDSKTGTARFAIVSVNVDDIVITGDADELIAEIKQKLADTYNVQQFEEVHTLLGFRVKRYSDGSYSLGVQAKIEEIFQEHPILLTKGKSNTPMSPSFKYREGEPTTEFELYIHEHFASLLGSLIYLSITCRPDLAQALGRCSRGMHQPTFQHVQMLGNMFRYLNAHRDLKLFYRSSENPINQYLRQTATKQADLTTIINYDDSQVAIGNFDPAVGFCDADYAPSNTERKSTTGYCFYLFGCLISWKSKLQPIVATSTHEAELIALGICADEAVWLRKVLTELGFAINTQYNIRNPDNKNGVQYVQDADGDPVDLLSEDDLFIRSIPILNDNLGSTTTANNPETTNTRSKAIDVRWFKVREYIRSKEIRVHYIPNTWNVSDVMTKPISNNFGTICTMLGLSRTL